MTHLATLAVAAHPGHGTIDPGSWVHYLAEPIHVAVLAGVAWAVIGAVQTVGALRRSRRASDPG
jgi:putative copper export protein